MVFCGAIFGDISEFDVWAIVAGAILLAIWSPSTVPDGVGIPCDAIPAPAGDVPPGIAGFGLAAAWELGAGRFIPAVLCPESASVARYTRFLCRIC